MNSKDINIEIRVEKLISRIETTITVDCLTKKLDGLGAQLGINNQTIKELLINRIIHERDYLIVLLRWAYQCPEYSRIEEYIDDLEAINNLEYIASVAFYNRGIFGSSGYDFFKSIVKYQQNGLLELDKESVDPVIVKK